MAVITGLTVANTRLANATLAATFFPRVMRPMWSRICGMTKSSAEVEPFAFLGAAPMLKLFNGTVQNQGLMSYSLNVPNPVYKNFGTIKRSQIEFDQTRSLMQWIAQYGVKVAQHWDYLLACRMLKASTSGSQNFTFLEDGKSYTMTYDNKPLFSLTHNTGAGTASQANIITGHLPTTVASLNSQDLAVSANQMQNDISLMIQKISTVVDDKGALVFPDFDPETQLCLVVPPALSAVANLAFRTQGTLGGSNGSSSGSTTNIGHKLIAEVITWNLLTGCPDVESAIPGATVSPTFATEYYAYVKNDFVKPWYFQRFLPVTQADVVGSNVSAEAERAIKEAAAQGLSVRPEAAELYAATEILTNLNAIGNRAQESVASRDEFFISARTRGQIFPGPWPTAWKIDPTGSST